MEPFWLRNPRPDASSSGRPGSTLATPVWRFVLALLVLGGLTLAFALWQQGAERRALEALAPAERIEAFMKARAHFQALCGEGTAPQGLAVECARQARHLRQFPECDTACQALTAEALPRPSR